MTKNTYHFEPQNQPGFWPNPTPLEALLTRLGDDLALQAAMAADQLAKIRMREAAADMFNIRDRFQCYRSGEPGHR